MADFYFSQSGDIKLSPNGDLALTGTNWRDDAQQAYIRLMTEPGDWTLYPSLGTELSKLYGEPQTRETAEFGKALIRAALNREGRFNGKQITINAVPTGPQTIRFDLYVGSPSQNTLLLSIEQELEVV